MFQCGYGQADISPPLGDTIPGYFETRLADGCLDPLYAKALVLDDGEATVALVALDAAGVEEDTAQRVRQQVLAACGLQTVFVCATHTHTGGAVYRSHACVPNPDYLDRLAAAAGQAAVSALAAKTEAVPCFLEGSEDGISFNRRYRMRDGLVQTNPGIGNPDVLHPLGPIDPALPVLAFKDCAGGLLGVLTGFACHPDCVGGAAYSADYPGALCQVVQTAFPGAFCVFLTGACGDINHLDVSGQVCVQNGHYRWLGTVLGGQASRLAALAPPLEGTRIRSRFCSLPLETRRPNADALRQAREALADGDATQRSLARQTLELAEELPEQVDVPLGALAIGPLCLVFVPGELFASHALRLKAASPFAHTVVATHAGGRFGYLPTRDAFEGGGYEQRLSWASFLEADAGDKITDALIAQMEALAADE